MSIVNQYQINFTSQDNESASGSTKRWFMNPGNLRKSKFCRWNPMAFHSELIQINITLTPRFRDGGYGQVFIIKNGVRTSNYGFGLYDGVSVHRYILDNPVEFKATDHIGIEIELREVNDETWPSVTCIFEKILDNESAQQEHTMLWKDEEGYKPDLILNTEMEDLINQDVKEQ